MKRIMLLLALVALIATSAMTSSSARAGEEFSVAIDNLGATATLVRGPFNIGHPITNCIAAGDIPNYPWRGGPTWGLILNQFEGAFMEVRILKPARITSIELVLYDYSGNFRYIKKVDVSVDGNLVKEGVEFGNEIVDYVDAQGRTRKSPPRVKLDLTDMNIVGQVVGIEVKEIHPMRTDVDNPVGWGGVGRIRVFSDEDFSKYITMPEDYAVVDKKAVAFSAALAAVPKVYAEVRNVGKTNPNTIWDKQDIDRMKEILKKSPLMQKQLADMKTRADERIVNGFTIPKGRQNAQGEWIHVSGNVHTPLSLELGDLGIIYALTDEEKYAEHARKIFLAYAGEYQNYRPGNRPGFTHDVGMLSDQRLDDSTWLLRTIRGYDLVYNLPSWTAEDRELVED